MRRNIKKAILLICTCVGLIVALCGCVFIKANKGFKKAGLTITLTTEFHEDESDKYTAYYISNDLIVAVNKQEFANPIENFSQEPNLRSITEYVEHLENEWYSSQGINIYQIGVIEKDGLIYFNYVDDEFGENFKVCCFGYKSADAFWAIRFACEETKYDSLSARIFSYAKAVVLDEEFEEILAFEKIAGKEEYRVVGLGTVCSRDIVVPAEYNGLPVTEIDGEAWGWTDRRFFIRSVVLPNTITKIESRLFSNMAFLKSVKLGNAVTAIEDYAFQGSYELEEVGLPDSVKSIGKEAFANCSNLISVNLGRVQTIGPAAFFKCKSLEKIEIPKTINTIGYSVFAGCSSLKSISIPNTVQTIGEAAFQGCVSLKEVVIPESVVAIKRGAFDQCFALEKVTIPDTVTLIEREAFENCDALQYNEYESCLYLGNETNPYLYLVKSTKFQIAYGKTHEKTKIIAGDAFLNCYNLMHFELGASVCYIAFNAFKNCQKLLEIYNKSSLNIQKGEVELHGGIGAYARNVYKEEGQGLLRLESNGCVLFEENESVVFLGYAGTESNVVLPANITEISPRAFYGMLLVRSITLGASTQKIGEYAFTDSNVNTVQFNENLKYIDQYAFYESNIRDITLRNNVKTIGEKAFAKCEYLQKLTLGDSVETIGAEAFMSCVLLRKVEIPDSVVSLGRMAFAKCVSLQEAIVGDRVCTEETDWFKDCSGLQRVVLGDSLTVIGERSFANLPFLTSVVIGNSIKKIGNEAFQNCKNLINVELGQCVKWIGARAFEGASFNQIELPKALETLGGAAFAKCVNLTSIIIPDSVKEIPNSAFHGCSALENVVLGNGVEKIESSAFYRCKNLKEIVFSNAITEIRDAAFEECLALKNVYCYGELSAELKNFIQQDEALKNAKFYFYSEVEPPLADDGTAYNGNYWHYNEDNEIVVWSKKET